MDSKMKKEKAAGCIIIKDNKVLLILQKEGNFWGFPKGHLEEGETELEAAKRETLEETGLEVEINTSKRYETNYTVRNEINKTSVFYLAKIKSGEIKKQEVEVEDIQWFEFDKALEVITYDDLRDVFAQVIQYLKNEK